MDGTNVEYAHLPDDLIDSIMGGIAETARTASLYTHVDSDIVAKARDMLNQRSIIQVLSDGDYTESIVAVDGARIVSRLPDMDLILVQAAGVEGLRESISVDWDGKNQYASWQAALPHSEANEALSRGVMSLMEAIVLIDSNHEICILDGAHITSILGMQRLVSGSNEGVDAAYVSGLRGFLAEHGKSIEDIPTIIRTVMSRENIIASTKYNSSRDITSYILRDLSIQVDDKSLCAKILRAGEYTAPMPVGQNSRGNEVFDTISFRYNLPTEDVDRQEFEWLANEAIAAIRTRDMNNDIKVSDIHYSYFKPYDDGPVYRLEFKASIAMDQIRLARVLRSVKRQVVFPDILEPYPQYLADVIAKSVSSGMRAIKEVISLSTDVKETDTNTYSLRNYRT